MIDKGILYCLKNSKECNKFVLYFISGSAKECKNKGIIIGTGKLHLSIVKTSDTGLSTC